jgi:hypothetical protein
MSKKKRDVKRERERRVLQHTYLTVFFTFSALRFCQPAHITTPNRSPAHCQLAQDDSDNPFADPSVQQAQQPVPEYNPFDQPKVRVCLVFYVYRSMLNINNAAASKRPSPSPTTYRVQRLLNSVVSFPPLAVEPCKGRP